MSNQTKYWEAPIVYDYVASLSDEQTFWLGHSLPDKHALSLSDEHDLALSISELWRPRKPKKKSYKQTWTARTYEQTDIVIPGAPFWAKS